MRSVTRSKVTLGSGNRIMETLAQVDQGLQSEAQGTRFVVLPVLLLEHRARDVEVGPGRPLGDELAKEEGGGDGAGQAAGGDVVDVGVGSLEGVTVLLDQGQLPEGLAVVLAGADDAADQLAVGAE